MNIKYQNCLLRMNKSSLNLKKIGETTIKVQVIISTLAESLVEGEITIDEEGWPKRENAMTLKAVIVRAIHIVPIVWLIYKVRIISTAILMSTRLAQVSWSDILNENRKWDHAVFVISYLYEPFNKYRIVFLSYK